MSDTSANNPNQGAGENPASNEPETQGSFKEAAEDARDTVIPFPETAETAKVAAAPAAADPLTEWKSKVAYLSAEIENMRKRFVREKQDVVKFANEDLIRKLLPVLDNLELGLKAYRDSESKLDSALRESPQLVNLIKGLDMTLKHFEQTLESLGCQSIKGTGENFDPNFHEALGQTQQPDVPDGRITGLIQRGFTLFGRVLRPARVMVNKAGTPSA